MGTAGWILAVISLLHAAWQGAALSRDAWRSRSRWRATLALGVTTGLGVFAAGPALGHRHSARDLAVEAAALVDTLRVGLPTEGARVTFERDAAPIAALAHRLASAP